MKYFFIRDKEQGCLIRRTGDVLHGVSCHFSASKWKTRRGVEKFLSSLPSWLSKYFEIEEYEL